MADLVLVLDGVWKGFHRGRDWLSVLEGVSLTVETREIVTVVGTRDQGKTTLLRVAAGTLLPEQGSVRCGELELTRLKDRELSRLLRSGIGLATRNGPSMRTLVRDYVGLPSAAGRWFGRHERRLQAIEVLGMLGIADCTRLRWGDLSDWQRVRVEFAQAVAGRPRVVLVDDVLDGLTFSQKQEAMDLLKGLADDLGYGVLMAASDHMSALTSDRVWQLDDGKLKLMADLTGPDIAPRRERAECSDEAAG
jgi:putative ABC transport system ATP-binding protein